MATNRFLDTLNIQPIAVNEGTGTAANTDWVDLEHYASAIFVMIAEDGGTGDDTEFKVQQATDNSASGAKDVEPLSYYHKDHASALSASGSYSVTTANDYDIDGDDENIVLVEVGADQLDVNGGFNYVSLRHDNGGANTKTFTAAVILCGPRYALDPTEWPSVS